MTSPTARTSDSLNIPRASTKSPSMGKRGGKRVSTSKRTSFKGAHTKNIGCRDEGVIEEEREAAVASAPFVQTTRRRPRPMTCTKAITMSWAWLDKTKRRNSGLHYDENFPTASGSLDLKGTIC